MSSGIVWFEVPASDSSRAREFYGGMFGWSFEQFGEGGYYVSSTAGGAVFDSPETGAPTVYFGVEDLTVARRRLVDLGGEAGEPQEIPGVGSYAICTDSEGNRIGLYQAREG